MAAITSNTGTFNWSNTAAWVGGVVPCKPFAITGAADNGSGLIRITLGSATPWATGDKINILGVVGTMVVNGSWTVTVIDSTHADLQGSSSTGTYTSGGTAFRGDTITMAAAAVFTIDSAAVDANGLLILGADVNTGGTNAITFTNSTTTVLTVGGAYTIRLRGGVSQPSSTWTFPAGASLVYDPPSGQQYVHTFDRFGKLFFNGTSGSHCTMKTDKSRGGTACYQTAGGVPQGPFLGTAAYTDFLDMGTATNFGIYTNITDSTVGNVSITNCTYTRCNHQINITSAAWAGNFTLQDCSFASSVGYNAVGNPNSCIGIVSATTPTAPGVHLVNRCSFDLLATMASVHDLRVTNCVFLGGMGTGGSSSWSNNTYFNNNFIYKTGPATIGVYGDTTNCYYFAQVGNAHYIGQATAGTTHTGWIFEQHGFGTTGGDGDIFLSPQSNVKIYKCLALAVGLSNDGTDTPIGVGNMVSTPGLSTGLVIEHCTMFSGFTGVAASTLESAASGANTIASCKSNIMFWPTTTTSSLIVMNSANATDTLTLSDYNGLYHATSYSTNTIGGVGGQTRLGYDGCKVTSSSQLGPNDFVGDPQFVDQDFRGFVKWYVKVKGGANSVTAALAYITANPAEIPNLIAWVFAGYRPTNLVYANATYPGDALATGVDAAGNAFNGTVGAMAFQAPAATASGAPLLMGF